MGPVNERGNCTWIAPFDVLSTALNGWSFLEDIFCRVAVKSQNVYVYVCMCGREGEKEVERAIGVNFTYDVVKVDFPVLRV